MKELLVYRYDEVIQAPIDIVFEYVDDDEKIKLWNSLFIENIYEKEEDATLNKPGTKFKTVQKIDKKTMTIDSELVEYEAPFKVVMHSFSREGTSISKYYLSREYNGTRLIVESSIVPSNFIYHLATKIFGKMSAVVYDEQFQRLKSYVEDEAEID